MTGTSLGLVLWNVHVLVLLVSFATGLPLQGDVIPGYLFSPPPGCAKELCYCHGHVSSCDGGGVVTYVPPLPKDTTKAVFTNFSLPNVTSWTLANISQLPLENISLTSCGINRIEPTALLPFTHLTSLNLSLNSIREPELQHLFENLKPLPLTTISLKSMNLKGVNGLSSGLASFPLRMIEFDLNKIAEVDMGLLPDTLDFISFRGNVLHAINLTHMSNLTLLDLAENRLQSIPAFCQHHLPLFPRLRNLRLNGNDITHIDRASYFCLSCLEYLDIGSNNIDCLASNSFAGMPSLQVLFVSNLGAHIHVFSSAFNNSNLQKLYLNYNRISHVDQIHEDAFSGCQGLRYLSFSNTYLGKFPSTYLSRLFAPLRSLKALQLQTCELSFLPPFLGALTGLELLVLSDNDLVSLDVSVLSKLTALRTFDVSINRLPLGTERIIPPELQDSLKKVNLNQNIFACSCDILWLKLWIERNTTHFEQLDDYHCSSPLTSTRLVDFQITRRLCLLSSVTKEIISAISSLLLLVAVVFPLVYRKRWHLEYLLFMLRQSTTRREGNRREARDFRFDAFVIYDSRDHAWVVRQLMPALEDTQGLRLCLHERDFLAGKLIVDNIVDSIAASRKVIAIMSEGTATSEWCQFELSLTHRLTLERGHDLMVVVMLQEVARAHVTRTMYAVLKMTTYIAWPDEERAREAFWNGLGEAVRD